MTTWTSRGVLLAGALLGLSGCEGLPALGLFDSLRDPAPAHSVALAQTPMAQGAVTLVSPEGFCIDPNTLRQSFALMARCDRLGAAALAGDAPMGLITVSLTPMDLGAPLPPAQSIADAAGLTRVDALHSEDNALTFRAEGTPPGADLDRRHWRALVHIDSQLLGIALYGPTRSPAVSSKGRDILNDLIRKTRAASLPPT